MRKTQIIGVYLDNALIHIDTQSSVDELLVEAFERVNPGAMQAEVEVDITCFDDQVTLKTLATVEHPSRHLQFTPQSFGFIDIAGYLSNYVTTHYLV